VRAALRNGVIGTVHKTGKRHRQEQGNFDPGQPVFFSTRHKGGGALMIWGVSNPPLALYFLGIPAAIESDLATPRVRALIWPQMSTLEYDNATSKEITCGFDRTGRTGMVIEGEQGASWWLCAPFIPRLNVFFGLSPRALADSPSRRRCNAEPNSGENCSTPAAGRAEPGTLQFEATDCKFEIEPASPNAIRQGLTKNLTTVLMIPSLRCRIIEHILRQPTCRA